MVVPGFSLSAEVDHRIHSRCCRLGPPKDSQQSSRSFDPSWVGWFSRIGGIIQATRAWATGLLPSRSLSANHRDKFGEFAFLGR